MDDISREANYHAIRHDEELLVRRAVGECSCNILDCIGIEVCCVVALQVDSPSLVICQLRPKTIVSLHPLTEMIY